MESDRAAVVCERFLRSAFHDDASPAERCTCGGLKDATFDDARFGVQTNRGGGRIGSDLSGSGGGEERGESTAPRKQIRDSCTLSALDSYTVAGFGVLVCRVLVDPSGTRRASPPPRLWTDTSSASSLRSEVAPVC